MCPVWFSLRPSRQHAVLLSRTTLDVIVCDLTEPTLLLSHHDVVNFVGITLGSAVLEHHHAGDSVHKLGICCAVLLQPYGVMSG